MHVRTDCRSQWLQVLDNIARKFDEFTSDVVKIYPGLELQEEPEETDTPDEISIVSTCATPTNPVEMFSMKSFSVSSNKNFEIEFFEAELDTFELFLSVHESVVAEKTRHATVPYEFEAVEKHLLSCQVRL